MGTSDWLLAISKIALAFGIMGFSVALGSALVFGVNYMDALYRAALAGGGFVIFGGVCSGLLAMFLAER